MLGLDPLRQQEAWEIHASQWREGSLVAEERHQLTAGMLQAVARLDVGWTFLGGERHGRRDDARRGRPKGRFAGADRCVHDVHRRFVRGRHHADPKRVGLH